MTAPSHSPRSLRAVRTALRALGLVAPGLAGALALQLMIRPRRRDGDLMARHRGLTSHRIAHRAGSLQAYSWPGKRRILLVHGWDAAAGDFATIIGRLQDAGWGGLTYDAPAHGRSDGTVTDFLDLGAAFRRALWQHGPFNAILGHSFGAAVVLYQLGQRAEPAPGRLVLGGAPTSLDQIFEIYADRLKLAPAVRRALNAGITSRLGRPAADFSVLAAIGGLSTHCLIVHDRADPLIPVAAAHELTRASGQAQLLQTRGLGHRGWLEDADAFAAILDFLGEGREQLAVSRQLLRGA